VGHFTINEFFLYVTNAQAYQQKWKNSSIAKKKSIIGSASGQRLKQYNDKNANNLKLL